MLLFVGLGFASAFLSGLVGLGGSLILIPALTYGPPAFGGAPIGMKVITGTALVPIILASGVGAWRHGRRGAVKREVVLALGLAMTAAALAGSLASALIDARVLEAIFASLAIIGALALLDRNAWSRGESGYDVARPARSVAVGAGSAIGLLSGLVGVGGAFLLIPVMVRALGVPLRSAIGSALAIMAMSASAAVAGKALTGQVDWALAMAMALGTLPGAVAGTRVSHRVGVPALAWLTVAVVLVAGVRMWLDVVATA